MDINRDQLIVLLNDRFNSNDYYSTFVKNILLTNNDIMENKSNNSTH